jgi:hypothetical protein
VPAGLDVLVDDFEHHVGAQSNDPVAADAGELFGDALGD